MSAAELDDVGPFDGFAALAFPFVLLYFAFRVATAGVRDSLAGGRW